ncbi:unnamed protein product [Amaranthus hypochondriacus]
MGTSAPLNSFNVKSSSFGHKGKVFIPGHVQICKYERRGNDCPQLDNFTPMEDALTFYTNFNVKSSSFGHKGFLNKAIDSSMEDALTFYKK